MQAGAPVTTNPLAYSPKACIAKYIPYKEYPSACSKQSGYKQSPLWHPSRSPLGDELSFDLKSNSISGLLGAALPGYQSNIALMSTFVNDKNVQSYLSTYRKHNK